MYTVHMPRLKGPNLVKYEQPTVTLRFNDEEEVDRVNTVLQLVYRRAPHASRNDMLKELMGLTDTGLITESERVAISGVANVELFGRASGISSDLELPIAREGPPNQASDEESNEA